MNKQISIIIKNIKNKNIDYRDIPIELRDNIDIIEAERKSGMRVYSNRGYDVVFNRFFVQEDIIDFSDNSILKTIITNFESFDNYYEYLNGNIYEKSCYYQCEFTSKEIKKYKIDINKIAEERNGGKAIKVVANLPYYITTPVIMGILESHVPFDSITVMVQKEVAQRMQAGPGTKDYGALSLAVQYYSDAEIVANVPANCFMPRPGVGSAVIRLCSHSKPCVNVDNEKFMFGIIRASFNQRRKTLQNGLANDSRLGVGKEQVAEALRQMGLKETIRGETLSLAQFAEFSNILGSLKM